MSAHRLALKVYPCDTDYSGVVSHRAIVNWLELARIEFVRAAGLEFAQLWSLGYDLPVVELRVRYRQRVAFLSEVEIETSLMYFSAPRLSWEYKLYVSGTDTLHVEGRSDHAIIEVGRGRPCRAFPSAIAERLGPLLVHL